MAISIPSAVNVIVRKSSCNTYNYCLDLTLSHVSIGVIVYLPVSTTTSATPLHTGQDEVKVRHIEQTAESVQNAAVRHLQTGHNKQR